MQFLHLRCLRHGGLDALVRGALQRVPRHLSDQILIHRVHGQTAEPQGQGVFVHPAGVIVSLHLAGVFAAARSLLVADPRLTLPLPAQQKQNVVGDALVHAAQHCLVQRRAFQLQTEHLQLRHCLPRLQVGGGRRNFVRPQHAVQLLHKAALHRRGNVQMLVKFRFGNPFVKPGAFGKFHYLTTTKAINSKSSNPCMPSPISVVPPGRNRLSKSFSSCTSMMHSMAELSRREQ